MGKGKLGAILILMEFLDPGKVGFLPSFQGSYRFVVAELKWVIYLNVGPPKESIFLTFTAKDKDLLCQHGL